VQQNDVAPVAVAPPIGVPPPASAHVPGLVSVGWLARVTNSGPWNWAHVLGAWSVPVVTLHPGVTETSSAGEPMVHWAPVGPEHWQGVHER
jgi:hypothetical protein